ncbi:hypothetical protein GQ53DRAFT_92096 [Thozetella sp. PMI_491]|nr:hypothetical protein GQ53DRAFT_92096 [Thozetella sp. PMI_491]
MRVEDLAALGGAEPPARGAPPTAQVVFEITQLYHELYSPGLVAFFESQWFDFRQPHSWDKEGLLRGNATLLDLFASFLQVIGEVKTTDPAEMVPSSQLEARVVWALASLPVSAVLSSRPASHFSPPPPDDPVEARNRVMVVEILLSGATLPANPLAPPPPPAADRAGEVEFWHYLAQFLLQSHSTDASRREQSLSRMRSLLDGRENRDVLYSIAVLRELSAQFDPALNEQTAPARFDESDPRSRLAVATRFIREQAASSGGTTNVVRRFAALAYKAFVRPGVNSNSTSQQARGHDGFVAAAP